MIVSCLILLDCLKSKRSTKNKLAHKFDRKNILFISNASLKHSYRSSDQHRKSMIARNSIILLLKNNDDDINNTFFSNCLPIQYPAYV